MRVKFSKAICALCVTLLLCAQFGALSHAAWHAGGHAHAAAHDDAALDHFHDHDGALDDESPAGQHAGLCVFDLAFGQVLGGVHAGAPVLLTVSAGLQSFFDLPHARLHAEALSPKSRGPPALL